MIPFKEIRSVIARGLRAELGIPVIAMNGGGDIPQGSFMTYHFQDFGSRIGGQPARIQDGDIVIQQEAVGMTVSFLSYANDVDDSITNAIRARDWFKAAGYDALKKLDVVVFDYSEIQNRDLNLEEEWERRQGFDVEFRTIDSAARSLEDAGGWIETATIYEG